MSEYFKSALEKIRSNLAKSEDLEKSWKFNPKTKQLVHPLHGAIAIKPHKSGGLQAVHNGASIGVFSNEAKLREGLQNYTNSLPTNRPMTRMHNVSSDPTKKDEISGYGKPPAPGSTSPQVNQDAAKQVEAGANWSIGQKMDYYKQNLMSGLGISKAEAYFRDLLKKNRE